jgi:16S rRNA (guanine966-N2)-methyltransferase
VRVIGGEFKRAKLFGPGPRNMSIRATYDRVRESVFDLLGPMDGLAILDLFAGSGGIGIEALSRGASRAVFVDHQPESVRMIRKNLEALRMTDRAEVARSEVTRYLRQPPQTERFDVVYIDPPYASNLFFESMALLGRGNMLTLEARLVGEHGNRPEWDEIGSFACRDVRRYGDTWISIWGYK